MHTSSFMSSASFSLIRFCTYCQFSSSLVWTAWLLKCPWFACLKNKKSKWNFSPHCLRALWCRMSHIFCKENFKSNAWSLVAVLFFKPWHLPDSLDNHMKNCRSYSILRGTYWRFATQCQQQSSNFPELLSNIVIFGGILAMFVEKWLGQLKNVKVTAHSSRDVIIFYHSLQRPNTPGYLLTQHWFCHHSQRQVLCSSWLCIVLHWFWRTFSTVLPQFFLEQQSLAIHALYVIFWILFLWFASEF